MGTPSSKIVIYWPGQISEEPDWLASIWGTRAPLGWDVTDPDPVARTVAFLLSDWSKGISGEIVHVDGGFHAMGADVRPRDGELGAAVAAAEEEPAPASDS